MMTTHIYYLANLVKFVNNSIFCTKILIKYLIDCLNPHQIVIFLEQLQNKSEDVSIRGTCLK